MKHIALLASAGSGKTFTLSVRYIALVLNNANINDIVALTFTKKAVNEMKERITNVFLNLENKEAELKQLEQLLKLNKEEILKLRNKYLKNFKEDELRIYTFDSFFSKILRLFASYEGLSVDSELIDYLDIKKEFINSLNHQEAVQLIKDLKNFNMSLDDFLNWLENLYLNYTGKKNITKITFVNPYEVFLNIKQYLFNINKKVDEWLNEINSLNELLKSSILDTTKKNLLKALENEIFATYHNELSKSVANYYAYLEQEQLNHCFSYLDKFTQIAKKIHKEENILSFSDVALYVHKILQNKDLKELFYFRLNSNLSHLLIDEFQDTSVIQYEIIKPIVEEIVSGIGINDKEKSFFYVGDKKQSIYSFRGAKQEVFDLFYKNPAYNITLQNLDTNYRSKKAIVSFVNNTFSKLYDEYYPQLTASNEEGKVSKIFTEDYLIDTYKKLISLLKNNVNLEDICILTRDNKNANEIAEFLNSHNINTNVNNSTLLVSKMSVRVLIEFAKYCIFEDEIYSFFVKSVLNKSYEKIKIDIRKNAYEIYNEIIEHLNIQKDEYILEFLNDISNCSDFLSTLYNKNTTKTSNKDNNGLNIMTIHKSKGLQFEHLICIHIDKKALHDTGLKIEYDFKNATWYGFKKEKKENLELRKKYQKDYLEKIQLYENTKILDEINTYYVAYTRAISSLCIILEKGAGLNNINYEAIEDEILSDDLLTYKIENNKQITQEKQYEFKNNIPLQNITTKQFYSDEIMLGNAFHYFCELSDFTQDSYDKCFEIVCNKFTQVDKNKLNILCNKLLLNKDFLQLIKNSYLIKESNYLHQGKVSRIDLLAINNEQINIIDYKSSFFKKEYEKQIKNYEEFIKKQYPNSTISSYVIFYENNDFQIKKV
ncbi:UvrD-helicase domain-containing protein [Campylobacter canadensis]|uniref:UvrD-helicase domain-containing protein n=1 Tax=Campylobacter canadensis TaxID=449520 RepID=UPI001CCBB403|nr:UvrD-helicase domain-containing protein [Campylobacter canadensis]MBZ7995712.1 UvrD-helicase domain-containing protein [Campylobacter canadensis]MBZ7999628.1 UvrD-helicase domain-containing protein [Campylobacter canadensis]MBZ8001285.1 UvrD-helicase domain-containing protein [Campylobacter canadensis]MBZ8004318.1 UvrD-helicase domain-containing protein [Campylobacter canadensis]